MKISFSLVAAFVFWSATCFGQKTFSRLDTLFGSNTPSRAWWDVQRYDVAVQPDYGTKSITGRTTITYKVIADKPHEYIQIDLQKPLTVDSIFYNGKFYINYPAKPYYNEGGHWFVPLPKASNGSTQSITIVYHGVPREAKNAPWDGGWVWTKDKQGRPWMSVACQGDGASLWYPCKDLWSDEPDAGVSLSITVPANLTAVGNGRLKAKWAGDNNNTWVWEVQSPINAYNVVPYIGHYANFGDTLQGEKGKLDLNHWVLDYEVEKAKKQFAQVKETLRALEHWFGPYPFYEDGYQLIQSPYLGMEHQSAVAYGNGFRNGYLGRDLSGSGWGLKWDYIIVHETGHEWFGNNVTAKDPADMWLHEGFTDYSETLFTEYYYGKRAGTEYVTGLRKIIENDAAVIGPYNVHREGGGDMYAKGANLLHTVRQVISDDEKFRAILRGLNTDFYHQTVTSKQVEEYISQKSGTDFSAIFNQYLRTTKIPVLEYKASASKLQYRWANVVDGFNMPVRLTTGERLSPSGKWQTFSLAGTASFAVDENFYVNTKRL